MAYTTIDKPTDYFSTNLWVADDASSRALTGFGHQPDLVWTKHRGSGATYHTLTDSVRGGDKQLSTPTNAAEDSGSHGKISAFGSDGITVIDGTNATYPRLTFNELDPFGASVGGNYVGWSWKAGTSFTNDASSTGIGSIDSAGSVNDTAGFSIVSYTGNGTSGATVKHGLSTAPSMIILKNRSAAEHWMVGITALGYTKNLVLSLANAVATDGSVWNNTAPTSSVFSVGNSGAVNTSSQNYIAYCFAEKQGYSKFGTYLGNSSTNGTFVYLGFKPAFVMVKKTNSANDEWNIFDHKRDPFNVMTKRLVANVAAADAAGTYVDFVSNGFKWRINNNLANGNGNTYIYMAFAENPFVTSTGVPATAR